jgi:hypothetical protein
MQMQVSQKPSDTELLFQNPSLLLIEIQGLIEIIVMKFIRTGGFSYHEKKDIIQTINEQLLLKIPKIKEQYKGISTLRSYLAVIIQNICNEILRKKKHFKNVELETAIITDDRAPNPQNALIIQQEIIRLRHALDLYHKQRNKLIICLKMKFRIPFSIDDFQQYVEKITYEEYLQFEHKVTPYIESTDLCIYDALIVICNKYENKNNTTDSLRKWVGLKIKELIEFLNGVPRASNYTEETLQILFEKFNNFIQNEKNNRKRT